MSTRRIRRVRGKHLEVVPATSSTSVSSHSFTPEQFLPHLEVHEPIQVFVDRMSEDSRRIYHEVIPIEPPSPIKRARFAAVQGSSESDARPASFAFPEADAHNDRYNMAFGNDEEPPAPEPAPRSRKGIFSDSMLYQWKDSCRDHYLRELLRRDGCAGASTVLCPGCNDAAACPAYRCRECRGGLLYCRECCMARHLSNPLHVIEAWNGTQFLRTSLKALGLRVQFGHLPGEFCASPQPARTGFVVLHESGIHQVAVNFCGCERRGSAGLPDTQLLRGRWYPASEERPQTCMTFSALDQFHTLTLQAKTTMYDYYLALEKLTSNDGVKLPDRYQRGGRGHDPEGAKGTKSGELAVRCPACPRPGVNLPPDWESAKKEERFIYAIFFALDACFRLKRLLVSSELKDPGLGTGWAYMLENVEFREFLLTVTDQKEMTTCSGLAALDYANTKFSRGYSTTGVGMVGDLQKGESPKFANMDYIFGSVMRHHDPLLRKTISYDIVCAWWKFLFERLLLLPPLVRCFIVLHMIVFVIPKMHIHAHEWLCGLLYSLNFMLGSGQTDGEGIERPWANVGGIAGSTRIMGPGAQHDTIDGHWGHWNWQKLISLAEMLRRKLDTALEQQVIQREALDSFSQQQQDLVEGWKKKVHDYEDDPQKQKNPYQVVVIGLTEMEVRLQFQKEEAEAAKRGVPAKHRVSPSEFMAECTAIEEQQRAVCMQAELKKARTTAQQIDLSALRTKLLRRLENLRKLQGTYTPASIVALEKREAPDDEQPENEPLFLPSALSEAEHVDGGCARGLLEMELLLRDAQCRSALEKLRHQLVIKACFLNYKSLHARHQGATTQLRTIVTRHELKIRAHSEKYQAAWNALFEGAGRDESQVGWKRLRKGDIRCMEDADDLRQKEKRRKRAHERRKRKLQELLDHGVGVPAWEQEEDEEGEGEGEGEGELAGAGNDRRGAGESRREISWIWTAAGSSGTDKGLEDALRIEWSKAYARSRRWDEEVMLLREEFRRLPISLEFEADLWVERGRAVSVAGEQEEEYAQGMRAYASKQAALFRDIAARAQKTETSPKLDRGKKRPRAAVVDPLAEGSGRHGEESEDGGDDGEVLVVGDEDGDAEEERGMVESDEVILAGEMDDF
ncbi:hypothetical protein DFH08DRAFT_977891 [Mycena albidolilacea]|uniref:CxC2-like cysteine cluster KDZ transposase-associated domain-containing protein n=1 Tax=Mycena albidolilacea TaxID=1033008 RepID=A0AAD6YZT5_9AGAR|nr:hypothetical protein DFH08DRAFT_977891 [Mycena albidolilacea]